MKNSLKHGKKEVEFLSIESSKEKIPGDESKVYVVLCKEKNKPTHTWTISEIYIKNLDFSNDNWMFPKRRLYEFVKKNYPEILI